MGKAPTGSGVPLRAADGERTGSGRPSLLSPLTIRSIASCGRKSEASLGIGGLQEPFMRRAAALADERDPPAGPAEPLLGAIPKGKGEEGAQPIRQRVQAAEGAASGASSALRQRRSSKAAVPPSSAASWRRRVAAMSARFTSPTTAARLPWRTPSSITREQFRIVAAFGKEQPVRRQPGLGEARREQIPPGQRPEHLASRLAVPAAREKRAASAARNRVAAASSPASGSPRPPRAAPAASPPPASRSSTAGEPERQHRPGRGRGTAALDGANLGAQGVEAGRRRNGHATRTLLFTLCSASGFTESSACRLDIPALPAHKAAMRLLRAASLAFLLLLAGPLPAQQPAARRARRANPGDADWLYRGSDIARDPAWRFGTLPNGLHYAVRRNALPAGQVSIRVRIDAGALHEADNERGWAHFVEHMLFRGTQNYPDRRAREIWQQLGASFGSDTNARTDATNTVYLLDLPHAAREPLDTSLAVLAEMMSQARIEPTAVEAERPVVLAEKRRRPEISVRINEISQPLFYAGLLYGQRDTIGTDATLNGATARRAARLLPALVPARARRPW